MKKLILLFLLIYNISYGQFELTPNQTNGKYSLATNNETFMGISSGNISAFVNFAVSDTSSNWTLLANQTNGKYSIITNAVPFMGKSAGTVQIPVVFDIGSANISFDSSLFVKRSAFSQRIEATGDFNIVSGGTFTFTGAAVGFNMNRPPAVFTINQLDSNTGIRLYKNNDGSGNLDTLFGDMFVQRWGSWYINASSDTTNIDDNITGKKLRLTSTGTQLVLINGSGTASFLGTSSGGLSITTSADQIAFQPAGVQRGRFLSSGLEVAGTILPDVNGTRAIGSTTLLWSKVYANYFISNDATKGIVFKDTQGSPHYWRYTVDNSGNLVKTDLGTTIP